MDQFANRPLYRAPSEPQEWFYNPQVVRTDSFVAFNTGAALGAKFFPVQVGDAIMWKQARLILGITLTVELFSTAAAGGDLYLCLARTTGTICPLGIVPPPEDGGASSLILGCFVVTQQPNGTLINTATKTVGIGYGRIPLLVRAGETLYFYANKGIDGGFNAQAIFYSIPAQI